MYSYKKEIVEQTNEQNLNGGLKKALVNSDIFIGVSVADILESEWVNTMANDSIVFAMANPNPEISIEKVRQTKIRIFGTGRSDYPNQINNVLAFPGIFRGALDIRAKEITDDMKLAAAKAIAGLIPEDKLKENCIIPSPLNKEVAIVVAKAVKSAV